MRLRYQYQRGDRINFLCILYGGDICIKVAMYIQQNYKDQFLKVSMSDFVYKFWLISVFFTNAKGGDCWNYDIFVISYNTYSILNSYQAHHSVYSSYRAFNGYQSSPIVKQFKPCRTVVTE